MKSYKNRFAKRISDLWFLFMQKKDDKKLEILTTIFQSMLLGVKLHNKSVLKKSQISFSKNEFTFRR